MLCMLYPDGRKVERDMDRNPEAALVHVLYLKLVIASVQRFQPLDGIGQPDSVCHCFVKIFFHTRTIVRHRNNKLVA